MRNRDTHHLLEHTTLLVSYFRVVSYVTSHCVDPTSFSVESSAKIIYPVESSATRKVRAQLQTNHL